MTTSKNNTDRVKKLKSIILLIIAFGMGTVFHALIQNKPYQKSSQHDLENKHSKLVDSLPHNSNSVSENQHTMRNKRACEDYDIGLSNVSVFNNRWQRHIAARFFLEMPVKDTKEGQSIMSMLITNRLPLNLAPRIYGSARKLTQQMVNYTGPADQKDKQSKMLRDMELDMYRYGMGHQFPPIPEDKLPMVAEFLAMSPTIPYTPDSVEANRLFDELKSPNVTALPDEQCLGANAIMDYILSNPAPETNKEQIDQAYKPQIIEDPLKGIADYKAQVEARRARRNELMKQGVQRSVPYPPNTTNPNGN